MTPTKRAPQIRNCPFCRIAMVASRTSSHSPGFDQYQCLNCGTVIRFDDGSGPDRIENGDTV